MSDADDDAWERFESKLADVQSVRDASIPEDDTFGLGLDNRDSASHADHASV